MRFGLKRIVTGMAAIATLATAVPLITASPASAAVASPAATVNGSVTMSPTSGTKSGNNFTSFTITLNTSTACPGDSASGNYLWQTFIVDASVDLQSVQFGSTGPVVTEAADTGKFARALYNNSNSRVVNKQTDIGSASSGPISGIGTLKFTANTAGTATIADGDYNVGVACTQGSAGTTQLKSLWSTVVTFSGGGTAWTTTQANTKFTALKPTRVIDTRPGFSSNRVVSRDKPGPATPLCVRLAGSSGVPVGAAAAVLNVTVTETSGSGFVTVYPSGVTRPTASSLNFTNGETTSNAVITPLSASGQACFFSSVPAHIVADVTGWFPTGASFTAVTPNRVFDTRPSEADGLRAVTKGKVGPSSPLEVQFSNLGTSGSIVPSSGVGSVAMNVTVTETDGPGFVTVYPCGTRPDASSINFSTGQTIPNAVISQLSGSGSVCFHSSVDAHLLADVVGWFASTGTFTPFTPARVIDTRAEQPDGLRSVTKTRIGPLTIPQVQFTDLGGLVPSSGVTAVSLNVTVASTDGPGFVTVYPCGTRPNASSLNFVLGETKANAVVVPVSSAGDVCFYSMTATELIVDINGYFS
jgi:hypothetical protein